MDSRRHRLFWWKEAALAAAFYAVYSWTRNQFGSALASRDAPPYEAFHNAEKVIQIERWLGLFHEESIQGFFLHFRPVIRFMNIYYGSAHFVVTIGVFALLFWKRPNVFPQWRNSLAFMTALAIFGFAFFPLMPPRLLDASCRSWGGDCIISRFRPIDGTFGFVDTLAHYGGLWSFNTSAMAEISNQYAAMPSLHIGWSTWCAIAMWPLMRRRWQRIAVLLYPLAHAALHRRHREPLLARRRRRAASCSASGRCSGGACTVGTRSASTGASTNGRCRTRSLSRRR